MAGRFLAAVFLLVLAASSGAGEDRAGKKEEAGRTDAASVAGAGPVIQEPESKPLNTDRRVCRQTSPGNEPGATGIADRATL
jgi:hypothetical protein